MPATLPALEEIIDLGPPDSGVDCGDPEDQGGEPLRWINVAIFWSPPEAHIARIKLESQDIDCQIADENVIAADFLLAPAVGGIKILVPEFQAERARALIAERSQATVNLPSATFGVCPECGSTNIGRPLVQAKTFWAGVVALMLMGSVLLAPLAIAGFVYYVIMWRPWRCRDCGDVFRREDAQRGFPIDVNLKSSPAAEE